jgi:ParB-like chromosome segregation protein Spo0J
VSESSTAQQPFTFGPQDPRYEAKFREWNLDYRFEPAFPIDAIRVADWAQVRQPGHIAPEEQVEEYRQQMANGAVFPPVVLMAPETLIDGNTRFKATKKLHKKTIAVYIVELASVPMAKSLAGAINNMGGKRLSAEEAAEAAKTMMDMNFTDENIAREIGRSVEQVRRIRNQIEFGERTRRLSMERVAEQVSADNRVRLNSVKHDPPFAAMIDFVAELAPPKKTVSDLLKQVNDANSDADAITVIETAKRDLKPAGPPPKRVTVTQEVQQMGMHLAGLLKYSDNPSVLFDAREDKREERTQQWQQIADLSKKMLEMYGVAERELVPA